MEPVPTVVVSWLLFAGTHLGLASGRLRAALHARLGVWGFTIIFSLVAATTYTLLVRSYAAVRLAGPPGLALGDLPMLRLFLMSAIVVGVVLTTASLIAYPRSPMALFGESVRTPYGIERITRHSFFVGIAIVATAHALLATHLVGTVFFAFLALFVSVGAWHQDRKLLALRGAPYAEYLAATSALPFTAVIAGRQHIVWRELSVGGALAGVVLAVLLRTVHGSIFAHDGVWVIGATIGGAALATLQAWRRAHRHHARRLAPRPT
jgi:uncharacterized membrane protein